MTCYFINMIMDIWALLGPPYDYSGYQIEVNSLTGEQTDCTDTKNHYSGQKLDLGIEALGVVLHIVAVLLAVRARNRLLNANFGYKSGFKKSILQ